MLNVPPKMSAEDAEFYDALDSVLSDPRKRRGSLASKVRLRRRKESKAVINSSNEQTNTDVNDNLKKAR